jgi:hypothetical protein
MAPLPASRAKRCGKVFEILEIASYYGGKLLTLVDLILGALRSLVHMRWGCVGKLHFGAIRSH